MMTKSSLLSGSVTLSLLAVIVFLVWGSNTQKDYSSLHSQSNKKETARTASLQRFSLADMVSKSDRIFRGTVTDLISGTVNAGGTELPTITYRFRVGQDFKGTFTTKGDAKYAEITMLGTVKKGNSINGNVKKFSTLPTPPTLQVGSDYLLLLTKESSIGLTSPMGLGQGSFEIYTLDKQELAKNEYNNTGLFEGPVAYSTLADLIKKGGK